MQTFYQILGLLAAGIIIYFLYQTIKNRPDQFSKANLSQSFSTMGILGIILIGFIALMVFMLR